MKPEMEALKASVAKIDGVVPSAIAFIGGLKTNLDQAIADADWPGVQAISDDLASQADSLAAAIATSPTA